MHRLACAALLVAACRAPLPEPLERPDAAAADALASLHVEPGDVTAAPPVLRIVVRFAAGGAPSSTLRLYTGELSRYHMGRILKEDLPGTLLARIVPTLMWTEGDLTTLAPSRPLQPGAYSLASQELGLIGVLHVTEAGAPFAARVWPPLEDGHAANHVIFCAEQPLDESLVPVRLDPGSSAAELWRGVGPAAVLAEQCAELVVVQPPAAALVVPPPVAGGLALDPAPLVIAEGPSAPVAVGCLAHEARFGKGCAEVQDDRALVRSVDAPLLWLVDGLAGPKLEQVPAAGRFVVLGLSPETAHDIPICTYDLAGRRDAQRASFVTGARRPHVVLNEVLADAVGVEPAQEWLELYNDGQEAVDLEGWSIEDVGGVTLLDSFRLEPGAFVLVVGADYDAATDLDVVAAPEVPLLRVVRLGKNGLSNAGERLILRDAAGVERSRFPALASGKPGRSVARRTPHSLDDDPDAFAPHAAPGASPGTTNAFE